jgi:hypothetical protein
MGCLWQSRTSATVAIFAKAGMLSESDKEELIRRRPATERIDLDGGSHDAHLDAFDDGQRSFGDG